jgi:hypothetical protein
MSKPKRKPKARMGRPPKPPELKQSKAVHVVITPGEYDALKGDAAAAGRTMAGHLRMTWLESRKG